MTGNYVLPDVAASIAAVILVIGVVILGALERPVPSEVSTSLGAAITWLFVRSTQQAERHATDTLHDEKS